MSETQELLLPISPADALDLLQNQTLKRALTQYESTVTEKWRRAATVDDREQCHARLSMLTEFLQELKKIVDRGTAAKIDAARRAKRGDTPAPLTTTKE